MLTNYMTPRDIAERLNVSRDAVYLWIREGTIPPDCVVRIAGTIRVDQDVLERHLRSGDLSGGRSTVGKLNRVERRRLG